MPTISMTIISSNSVNPRDVFIGGSISLRSILSIEPCSKLTAACRARRNVTRFSGRARREQHRDARTVPGCTRIDREGRVVDFGDFLDDRESKPAALPG